MKMEMALILERQAVATVLRTCVKTKHFSHTEIEG